MPPTYDGETTGPGKSAEVDAIAHAAAAQLKTTGQGVPEPSTVQDSNHDQNETPQGNPGRMGSAS